MALADCLARCRLGPAPASTNPRPTSVPPPPGSDLEARLIELLNMKGRQRYKWESLTAMLANNVVYDDKAVRRGGRGPRGRAPAGWVQSCQPLHRLRGGGGAAAPQARPAAAPGGLLLRFPPPLTLPRRARQLRAYVQPEPQPPGAPRLGLLFNARQAEVSFDQPAALLMLNPTGALCMLPVDRRGPCGAAVAALARAATAAWWLPAHDGWQLVEGDMVSQRLGRRLVGRLSLWRQPGWWLCNPACSCAVPDPLTATPTRPACLPL